MHKRALRIISGLGGVVAILALTPSVGFAQEYVPTTQDYLNNVWVFIAGVLVFFMQAGFALVEAGLTRAKNVVNIFAKNLSDAVVGILAFFAVGYAFAFGSGGGWFIGSGEYFLSGADIAAIPEGGLSVATTFFFQAVFAATAVTIASGAMAERTKFSSYLIFSAIMCAVIYPVVVHWTWGGGLIADIGWSVGTAEDGSDITARFSDFAGSGVVHMTGGIAALMGAYFLGPRIGKFDANGKARAIPGHNIPFVILGVFISVGRLVRLQPRLRTARRRVRHHGRGQHDDRCSRRRIRHDDRDLARGRQAGPGDDRQRRPRRTRLRSPLRAGAVTPVMSMIIGAVAGALVVGSVYLFDKIKIDDPVGAVSVHGICGMWGVLSIGLFARYDDAFLGREDAGLFYGGGFDQLGVQALMILIIGVWVTATTSIVFAALKATIGLRVTAEEEIEGLDFLEHGLEGYAPDTVTSVPASAQS